MSLNTMTLQHVAQMQLAQLTTTSKREHKNKFKVHSCMFQD